MDLTIKISGIEDNFNAHSFYYKRSLGCSIEYVAVLLLNYGNRHLLENISEKLKDKETSFSIEWKGEKILDQLTLFQCKYIHHDIEPRLQLVSLKNKYSIYNRGPFIPRKRVLKAANMLDLFRKYFSDLVELDDHVEYTLQQVKFPDKEKTNIIQYLQTDHEMLCKILNWYNYIAQKKETLILSGSANSQKYQLTWIQPTKCASLNYTSNRRLDDKVASTYVPDIRIGFDEMPAPEVYKANSPTQNVVYILNRGDYNSGEWGSWKTIDVPSYYKNRFVYEIIDTLTDSKVGNLGWVSRIATLAKEEELNITSQEFLPWTGIAKVKNKTETDFWMEAELPEFESDSNIVNVRITTNYSGHDGNAGLHLIPEKDTEVLIHKGSNWKDPVVLISNVRSKTVIEKAPFWKLEDTAKWDFTTLSVKLKDITTAADDHITLKTSGVTAKIDNKEMDIS